MTCFSRNQRGAGSLSVHLAAGRLLSALDWLRQESWELLPEAGVSSSSIDTLGWAQGSGTLLGLFSWQLDSLSLDSLHCLEQCRTMKDTFCCQPRLPGGLCFPVFHVECSVSVRKAAQNHTLGGVLPTSKWIFLCVHVADICDISYLISGS